MRAKDTVTQNYLSDPKRFAQICNNELFHGETMIAPQKLLELDSVHSAVGLSYIEKKYRDNVKLHDSECLLVILGLENQTDIHYAMPLRNYLYDAINYEKQRAVIAKQHKEDKNLKGEEFISRFSKNDKLIPVITLVIYYGTKPWDGPRNLHEMLQFSPGLETFKDLITNYKLHLLEVNSMSNLDQYTGELKAFFGFVKYQKDKQKLLSFVMKNEDIFRAVSHETAYAIQTMAHVREFDWFHEHDEVNKETEVVDMCQALQDLIADSRSEGRLEGKSEGRLEGLTLGEENGTKKYGLLVLKLLEEGKDDLLIKTTSDPGLLHQLYKEYHISDIQS